MLKSILIYTQVCVLAFLLIVRETLRRAKLLFGLETLIAPAGYQPKGKVFNVSLM